MSAEQWLALALGGAMLAIAAVDIHSAVLHHWGSAGPFTGRAAGWAWAAVVRVTAGMEPSRRRRVLGQVGPLMIPTIVGAWALWIILAFAVLYWPWVATNFGADTGVPTPGGFGDALHFSGVSFFTIGYGDIVPMTSRMRALGVIEGGAGFAFVTLVISYFTSLYSAYSQQRTTAASVHFQTGMTADAARLIACQLADESTPVVFHEVSRLRDSLAAIRATYLNYPILHYFIAARAEQSLIRLLFVAQDLRLLLDCLPDAERYPSAAGLGTRSGLLHAVAAVQSGVVQALIRPPHLDRVAAVDPAREEAWLRRFERARDTLRKAGIRVNEDSAAAETYCRARAEWEIPLRAAAFALGEQWEDVTAGF